MTTTANQQAVNAKDDIIPGPIPIDTGSGWKVTGGSAGLVMLIMTQVMGLYLQILDMERKQKTLMLESQKDAALAQKDATISAGNQQKLGLVLSGSLSIGGAVAGAGVNMFASSGAYKEASNNASEAGTELKSLKTIDTALVKDDATSSLKMTTKPAEGDDKLALVKKMKTGDFFSDPATTATLKAMKSAPIDAEDSAAYADIKAKLDQKMTAAQQRETANVRKMGEVSTSRQSISQLVNSVGQGSANIAQGLTKVAEAEATATSQVMQVAGTMAAAQVQSSGEAAAKDRDEALAVVQTVREMVRDGKTN